MQIMQNPIVSIVGVLADNVTNTTHPFADLLNRFLLKLCKFVVNSRKPYVRF
jgi:hypothetical protein